MGRGVVDAVETMRCLACGHEHEIVGRWGELPILHCPTLPISERVVLVSDLSQVRA